MRIGGGHGREVVRAVVYKSYCFWGDIGEVWVCMSAVVWVRSRGSWRVECKKVIVTCEDEYLGVI